MQATASQSIAIGVTPEPDAPTLGHQDARGSITFSTSTAGQLSPSFEIRGAGGEGVRAIRLDRINSRDLFARARWVLFHHQQSCLEGPEPLGVVMPLDATDSSPSGRGRIVFTTPVLLPDEQFLPLDLLLGRGQRFHTGRRSRLQIPRPGR